jgi:hypothetical protein
MGLDARVYCDCYEKGTVRRPPPQPELVYVDSSGQLCLKWDDPRADQHGFHKSLKDACEHGPWGELVSCRLGNITLIAFLRGLLSGAPECFPVLLTKVVHNGVHCGDFLDMDDVERLLPEMDWLRAVHCGDRMREGFVRAFERQMSELIAAARSVRKPIVF